MCCKLCLQKKPLRDSHIIPEFLYKHVYDDKHRFNILGIEENKRKKPEQKGLREELLCGSCEGRLSGYERYASQVLFGGLDLTCTTKPDKHIISELKHKEFKIFLLSLLWRASICSRSEFSEVTLGEKEDNLREMIDKADPGEPDQYGCMLIAPREHRNIINRIIISPEVIDIKGRKGCRFMMAGVYWIFFVDPPPQELLQNEPFLNIEGVMPIFLESKYSAQFIESVAFELKDKGKLK